MEFFNRLGHRTLSSKVREGFSRFFTRNSSSESPSPVMVMARGVGLLMGATVLAGLSLDASKKTTIVDYRSTHMLPFFAWKSLILSSGYHPVPEAHDLTRLIRSQDLPSAHEVRASPDRNLLILPSLNSDTGITLWARSTPFTPPAEWESFPATLSGFEELAKLLETAPAQQVSATIHPPAKKAKWIDPKVFRY